MGAVAGGHSVITRGKNKYRRNGMAYAQKFLYRYPAISHNT